MKPFSSHPNGLFVTVFHTLTQYREIVDGSLTTLHAGTAEEAISRLILMARFGMDLPANLIEEQVVTALDFVVMGKRYGDGKRLITSMSQVSRDKDGSLLLEPVVSFSEADKSWHLEAVPQFIRDAVLEKGLTREEVEKWRLASS